MEFNINDEDVKDIIRAKIDEYEFQDVIEECAYKKTEEYMDKQLSKGHKLERLVMECAKEQTDEWLKCNIYDDILQECIKKAILERLREFSFEQIKELMNNTK